MTTVEQQPNTDAVKAVWDIGPNAPWGVNAKAEKQTTTVAEKVAVKVKGGVNEVGHVVPPGLGEAWTMGI